MPYHPYEAELLPLPNNSINCMSFLEELLAASSKLEVYKEKLKDSKLDSYWFMPLLQKKESLASSVMEGTKATLEDVLSYQNTPNIDDTSLIEVENYNEAMWQGFTFLSKNKFSNDFFFTLHNILMYGSSSYHGQIGQYRACQNYISREDNTHTITYIPPSPDKIQKLMTNLIDYLNSPKDSLPNLVRAAIVHAQFETIHPFEDGNGRVGRILIPLQMVSAKLIDLPCFFISEALEANKHKYYNLLNGLRTDGDWNAWIMFFLESVARQCGNYINLISEINALYEKDLKLACEGTKTSNAITVMNTLYRYPVTNSKRLQEHTNLPPASLNRMLNSLVGKKILYTDNRQRRKTFYYYGLLNLITK